MPYIHFNTGCKKNLVSRSYPSDNLSDRDEYFSLSRLDSSVLTKAYRLTTSTCQSTLDCGLWKMVANKDYYDQCVEFKIKQRKREMNE